MDYTLSIDQIAKDLKKETDRAAAVLAGALLESQLETLLRKNMINHGEVNNLFENFGPLGTFASKSSIALTLGIIPEDVFNELKYIRKIRNAFAHNLFTSGFDKSPIIDFVKNLKSTKWLSYFEQISTQSLSEKDMKAIRTNPRREFEIAVGIISISLDRYCENSSPAVSKKWQFPWKIRETCPTCSEDIASVPEIKGGDEIFTLQFNCPNGHKFEKTYHKK